MVHNPRTDDAQDAWPILCPDCGSKNTAGIPDRKGQVDFCECLDCEKIFEFSDN